MTKAKDKEIAERGNWTGQLDFLLSCIGYAVGLGNVWRFPYLCYRNGGGAFLIPYAIMLFIAGIPIFYFELCLGQFASQGPITVWSVSPFFMGIGWGMVIISAMVCIYYNVIIMYSIYYMFVSFVHLDDQLPWEQCGKAWNTLQCRTEPYPNFASMNATTALNESLKIHDTSCVTKLLTNLSDSFGQTFNTVDDLNHTIVINNASECALKFRTASEEYWTRYVLRLHEADGIGGLNDISTKNILCLLFAWVFIFFCLMKGIKSSGKVVYFTATFPYVVLIILLIRGVTLPGYYRGIEFYIFPKWEKLQDPKVWGDAATQIFYSLGPAFGGLLTMASYNKFNNNTLRDAWIVSLINCGTSVFAGFAIFSLLGYMSYITNVPVESVADSGNYDMFHTYWDAWIVSLINCCTSVFAGFAIFSLLGYMSYITNVPVEEVADSGPGLAFVAYPEGLAKLPSPPIWAFLFFFMIFTLGLDSQFAMMETILSAFSDMFPRVLRRHKALFTFCTCMIGFVLGIPQVTKGGIYVLTLIDWYSGSYNLMIISLCELVAVCYVYGVNNFRQDIQMMLGYHASWRWIYWYCTWLFITPVSIAFIVIMSGVKYTKAYYGSYVFPDWAQGVGWIMVCAPLAAVLLGMIIQTIRYGGIRKALRPTAEWGPLLDEDRTGRYQPINAPAFDDMANGKKGNLNQGYTGDQTKGAPYVVNDGYQMEKM